MCDRLSALRQFTAVSTEHSWIFIIQRDVKGLVELSRAIVS